jgi:hypothetical protein
MITKFYPHHSPTNAIVVSVYRIALANGNASLGQ